MGKRIQNNLNFSIMGISSLAIVFFSLLVVGNESSRIISFVVFFFNFMQSSYSFCYLILFSKGECLFLELFLGIFHFLGELSGSAFRLTVLEEKQGLKLYAQCAPSSFKSPSWKEGNAPRYSQRFSIGRIRSDFYSWLLLYGFLFFNPWVGIIFIIIKG